jgi:hypothetical protein
MSSSLAAETAIARVREFMMALAARELPKANAMLASGFHMIVSGNHRFERLEDFAAFSRTRNGAVVKHPSGFDVATSDDATIVYAYGTMSGQWLNGGSFAQVRYVDRFLLRSDKILQMDVYSDMAEFRPADTSKT